MECKRGTPSEKRRMARLFYEYMWFANATSHQAEFDKATIDQMLYGEAQMKVSWDADPEISALDIEDYRKWSDR